MKVETAQIGAIIHQYQLISGKAFLNRPDGRRELNRASSKLLEGATKIK